MVPSDKALGESVDMCEMCVCAPMYLCVYHSLCVCLRMSLDTCVYTLSEAAFFWL